MVYKLQRLGFCAVLDQAIAISRDHFRLLFSLTLVLEAPFLLIFGVWAQTAVPPPPVNPTPEESMRYLVQVFGGLPHIILGFIGYMLIVWPLTKAMLIRAIALLYLSEPVSFVEIIKHTLRHCLPVLITWTLMFTIFAIGFVCCMLPVVPLYLLFGLAQIVTVVEGVAGPAALGRSFRLASPHWLTFLGVMFFTFVIAYALQVMPNLIPQGFLQVAVSTLVSSVLSVFATATTVVFYFSCRCAVEYFDLYHLAKSIRVEPLALVELGDGVATLNYDAS
ncbi:MAG: hypothetical protein WD669_04595 [Pirellulales bacterium]